jgi:hypothetical protein
MPYSSKAFGKNMKLKTLYKLFSGECLCGGFFNNLKAIITRRTTKQILHLFSQHLNEDITLDYPFLTVNYL